MPPLSVVTPFWLDRPPVEALDIARAADAAAFDELWIGEMRTFDAFALAAAVLRETTRLRVTVGPLAVGVRTAASLALGMSSLVELGGRPASLALGASTPLVVSAWHGLAYDAPVQRMRETVEALRPMLAGGKSSYRGRHVRSSGFHTAAAPSRATVTIAAFGARMLDLAANVADRVVLNLVTPAQVARAKQCIDDVARRTGREAPRLAVWVPVALEPAAAAWQQIARQLVVYLAPPGYGEMFTEAGFGDIVAQARGGAHPRDLMSAMPRELAASIGAFASGDDIRRQLASYASSGADEIAVAPVTAEDEAARRVLATLAAG